ncbi:MULTISPECIES: helicase-related protein [Brevibacterium]|nr:MULTISPECIES: helicase C-terminal domain-containing protein [Brevibacterium]
MPVNHLAVYGDGRKVALDPRMVGEEFSGDVKLNYVTRRIAQVWRENRDNEYLVPGTPDPSENRGALQIVFCDLSTPNETQWNAYDQMKSDLASQHGMDRERIRFIHEAKDDEQRALMFKDAREGRIDVLIGSSQKMGTGANIQARAIAMHHVDCPWRPDELEQREGRILRQGNQNGEVQVYRYATEDTFDSTSWDIIGRKATAIAQVMRGRLDVRELDDPGDLALDAQQMMAGSSGNPLLVERTELDVTVQKLSRRARGHEKAQSALKYRKTSAEQRIAHVDQALPQLEEAIARRRDTQGDGSPRG